MADGVRGGGVASPAAIRSHVLRRPPAVRELLRIIATKMSVEDGVEVDEDEGARMFARALREWDEVFDQAREITEISEASLAELVIDRLRKNPEHGWDRILRGKAN